MKAVDITENSHFSFFDTQNNIDLFKNNQMEQHLIDYDVMLNLYKDDIKEFHNSDKSNQELSKLIKETLNNNIVSNWLFNQYGKNNKYVFSDFFNRYFTFSSKSMDNGLNELFVNIKDEFLKTKNNSELSDLDIWIIIFNYFFITFVAVISILNISTLFFIKQYLINNYFMFMFGSLLVIGCPIYFLFQAIKSKKLIFFMKKQQLNKQDFTQIILKDNFVSKNRKIKQYQGESIVATLQSYKKENKNQNLIALNLFFAIYDVNITNQYELLYDKNSLNIVNNLPMDILSSIHYYINIHAKLKENQINNIFSKQDVQDIVNNKIKNKIEFYQLLIALENIETIENYLSLNDLKTKLLEHNIHLSNVININNLDANSMNFKFIHGCEDKIVNILTKINHLKIQNPQFQNQLIELDGNMFNFMNREKLLEKFINEAEVSWWNLKNKVVDSII